MTQNYTITIHTPADDPYAYTVQISTDRGQLATFTGPCYEVEPKLADRIMSHFSRALAAGAEVVQTYTRGDGREYLMTRRGRDYTMTGSAGGPHTLTDASEERAMAHWKGYRGQ